jgi:hypothetical protein
MVQAPASPRIAIPFSEFKHQAKQKEKQSHAIIQYQKTNPGSPPHHLALFFPFHSQSRCQSQP